MKAGKFSKSAVLAILSFALILCSAVIATTVLAASQFEEAGGPTPESENDSIAINDDGDTDDGEPPITDEPVSAPIEGNGAYDNPYIITSEQEFDALLAQSAQESSKVYFYQVTGGVAPLRESNSSFIFAEIVFSNDGAVLKNGIYCLKTSYKGSGEEYYHFSVPVPSGYKWRRNDFAHFGREGIEGDPGYILLQPGVNNVSVRRNISLTGNGERHSPYIIKDEATWDFIFDYNNNQWVSFRVEGLTLAELTAAKPKYTGNCWWIDLRTENKAIIRLGLSVIHNVGILPPPVDYELVNLPYEFAVNGSRSIVVAAEGRVDYVPAELKHLPLFISGSIADVDKGGNEPIAGGVIVINASITPTKADFDINDGKNIPVSLNRNNLTLKSLKNGSYTLKEGVDYSKSGDTVTIKSDYLATLAAGTYTIIFEMNGGVNPKLTLTVMDTTLEEPEVVVEQLISFAPFIEGFENNTFRGDFLITREQFITILYRLKNPHPLPIADEANPSFKDVASGRWSYNAIEWANKAGLIEAGDDGNFRPAEQLTRAEMAVILVKADNLTAMAENTFSDIVEHPNCDDILKAVRAKIFTGYPDGSFKPEGFSTRAEAVTALIRYLLGGEPADEMWQNIELNFGDVSRTFWAFKYIALAVKGL